MPDGAYLPIDIIGAGAASLTSTTTTRSDITMESKEHFIDDGE